MTSDAAGADGGDRHLVWVTIEETPEPRIAARIENLLLLLLRTAVIGAKITVKGFPLAVASASASSASRSASRACQSGGRGVCRKPAVLVTCR